MTTRTCGNCYACCIHLGVNELKKFAGEACIHLDSRPVDAHCSIYAKRPHACVKYKCGWIEGLMTDDDRPDASGIIVNAYPRDENAKTAVEAILGPNAKGACATIQIIDATKARDRLSNLIKSLLSININDIRIVDYNTRKVIHFLDGNIRQGKLHKSKEYEALVFEVYDPPIGKFLVLDKEPV